MKINLVYLNKQIIFKMTKEEIHCYLEERKDNLILASINGAVRYYSMFIQLNDGFKKLVYDRDLKTFTINDKQV